MLDYEIKGYKVWWKRKNLNGKIVRLYNTFDTEEKAIEFVKTTRHLGWLEYGIEQIRIAIIDF